MKRKMKIGKFLIIAGVAIIIVGIVFSFMGHNKADNATEQTMGIVTDYSEGIALDGRLLTTVYYPIVSYEVNGNTVASEYSQRSDEKIYDIGDKVEIKYNPDEPAEFIIVGDSADTNSSGLDEIILGAIAIVIGIICNVISKRKEA